MTARRWLFAPVAAALALLGLVVVPTSARAFTSRADAVSAAASYGSSRGFHVGVAVLDTSTGWLYGAGDYTGTFASESVVKAFIATRLLVSGQMHGTTESLAYKMITQSDDAIASQLYGRVGGDGLISWIKQHYHLYRLGSPPRLPGWWGNTHITPRGLVHFYAHVKKDPKVGPWLLNAMHHATPYGSDGVFQFFGLPSATHGAAVKQGWGCDYDDFCTSFSDFNSTGFVNGDRYAVALLARGPLSAYGSEIAGILTGAATKLLPAGVFPYRTPVVTSMSTHWTKSAGGDRIIVHGKGFTNVTRVDFGTIQAPSFTVLSPWRVGVSVPAHEHGLVNVRVSTAAGTTPKSTKTAFNYVNPAWVSAMSTHSGKASGGGAVTIVGYNFRSVQQVLFGATTAAKVTVLSPNRLLVVTPAHEPGLTHIRIVTAYGTSATRAIDEYRFVAVPQVGEVAPLTVPHSGGTTVTLGGVGFRGVRAVLVGGIAATGVRVASWGRLSFVAPAHARGAVHVQVVTAYGRSAPTGTDRLTYS